MKKITLFLLLASLIGAEEVQEDIDEMFIKISDEKKFQRMLDLVNENVLKSKGKNQKQKGRNKKNIKR